MMLVWSLFCLCSQERVEREQYQSVELVSLHPFMALKLSILFFLWEAILL